MSEPDFGRIARGLMKAVSTPTDEFAATGRGFVALADAAAEELHAMTLPE